VWQGRFNSSLVSDDEYLLTAMQYIEQNPARARLVTDPGEYLFSSYRLNVRHEGSKLIDRADNPVFQGLGVDDVQRCLSYRQRMALRLDDDCLKNVRKSFVGTGGYLSERFKLQMASLLPLKRRPGRPRKTITT
jgi:putative transposase